MLATSISDALFTKTQQRVLSLLYSKPDNRLYTNEIVRLADMGRGTVRRELERLVAAGLLLQSKEGNLHHYRANPDNPIFNELVSIVRKTFGMVEVLQDALITHAEYIDFAFVYGSVASGKETSASDVDLLIIGTLKFGVAVKALHSAEEVLSREINPKIFSIREWKALKKNNDVFYNEVIQNSKLFLIGSADEFK